MPSLPPPKLARLLDSARNLLASLLRTSAPAPVAALDVVLGAWLSQAVCAAAALGVADALAAGPRSLPELARELDCNQDALERLLRLLSAHGFFRAHGSRYENTRLSSTLCSVGASSIRDFALYVGSAEHRRHWSELEHSVRSGHPAVEAVRGLPFFEYAAHEPSFGALFDRAMTGLSALARDALLSRYDFAPFRLIVDVGGGEGQLLAELLKRTPALRGILFDRPDALARAPALFAAAGVADRAELVGGSFLASVPPGGDVYLLKHILHDWPDDRALTILQNVRAVIGDAGRLLVFESVVPEHGGAHLAKLTDLEMLLCLRGRERTREQFRALFRAAGFELVRVIDTAAPISILEGAPARA